MEYYVIIPAHNEEKYLKLMLDSLIRQSLLPKKTIIVNDNSVDKTKEIAEEFSKKIDWIKVTHLTSENTHLPGTKVVNAFNYGLTHLDEDYDFIVKLDADLILPENYFEEISKIFLNNSKAGMAGGLLYIEKNNEWVYENISNKNHLRGPIKSYSKQCFKTIGGLKPSIGWDTVDTLLAKYNKFEVIINNKLKVKHLKPTGFSYKKNKRYLQGEALYKMRYGIILTLLTGLKMAKNQRKPLLVWSYIYGFYINKLKKTKFIVSKEEGKFIRNYRFNNIKKKIVGN